MHCVNFCPYNEFAYLLIYFKLDENKRNRRRRRMIKVKFFEQDSEPFNESFLLSTLSVDYRKIVNLLVQVSGV